MRDFTGVQDGRTTPRQDRDRQRGRTKAGYGEKPGDDYIMAAEDVAKVAVLMAALPDEVNLYEATILPNSMRSFIGRG